MAVSITTMDYALKELFSKQVIDTLTYKGAGATFARIKKDFDFGGRHTRLACIYNDTPGVAATFATAQLNKGNHSGVEFQIDSVDIYGLADITGKAIRATRDDKKALVKALGTEVSSAFNNISNSLGRALFGNGSGQIGTISASSGTSTTLTLDDKADVVNFEVGMNIIFAANDTSTPRDTAESVAITAINRSAGTMTISAALTTVAAAAVGDAIFREGDYVSASDRLMGKGLGAWLPYTAPTGGDSFFGVDRSVDVTRLSGQRIDGTSVGLDEALFEALTVLEREGATPNHIVMNPDNYRLLHNLLGSRVQYTTWKDKVNFGFNGMTIQGGGGCGAIQIFSDRYCPADRVYVLSTDTIKLLAMNKVPDFLMEDDTRILRNSDADSYEVRLGGYYQYAVEKPNDNCVIAVTSSTAQ